MAQTPAASAARPYTKTAVREARWVMTFAPGTLWLAGSFHHPSTEPELIRMGVLVRTDDPRTLVVAHIDNLDALPVRR